MLTRIRTSLKLRDFTHHCAFICEGTRNAFLIILVNGIRVINGLILTRWSIRTNEEGVIRQEFSAFLTVIARWTVDFRFAG